MTIGALSESDRAFLRNVYAERVAQDTSADDAQSPSGSDGPRGEALVALVAAVGTSGAAEDVKRASVVVGEFAAAAGAAEVGVQSDTGANGGALMSRRIASRSSKVSIGTPFRSGLPSARGSVRCRQGLPESCAWGEVTPGGRPP